MKKILLLCLMFGLAGCSEKKPRDTAEGGFLSMEKCISSVKKETGRTPVVKTMNEMMVGGGFDGAEGVWSCEMKRNKTNMPFYGFYSVERE